MPWSTMDVRESLRRCGLFEPLSDTQIETLGSRCSRRSLAAGEKLFSAQGRLQQVFVVEHGTLSVKLAGDGRRVISAFDARPGQLFGWSALIAPQTAEFAEAVALDDSSVLVVPAADLEDVLLLEPAAAYAFMKRIAGLISVRLRDVEEEFVEILGV
jgi:CRP-like cAMP-binding protein